MVIHFIEKGTLFDIDVLGETPDLNVKLKGSLYEVGRHDMVLIKGNELYECCMSKYPGLRLSFAFFRGPKEYSFRGKLERTLIKYNDKLTEVAVISGIDEKNRRSLPRMEISVPIKLYIPVDGDKKELICEGQTVDLNFDGICFLSNELISVPDSSKFYIEFTLFRFDRFFLPAKLVRKGNAPQSVQFKYDYAFVFDFSYSEADKNRMIASFFNNRLDSRRL